MKKILLIIGISFCLSVQGQSFYSIEKIGTKYTKSEIELAINKADWCGYIHLSETFYITFVDGTIVAFTPFNKLKRKKENMIESCYQSEFTKDSAIYHIGKENMLFREAQKSTNIKSINGTNN
jgi:hypothetical protein